MFQLKRWVAGLGTITFMMAWMANAAWAQSFQEPAWPQPFQVLAGESTSFGFLVTQAGPITVTVASQGAPIVVALTVPLAQPVQQQGSGTLRLSYNATAADVQRSYLWMVRIVAASPSPAPKGPPPLLASGSIMVQHPPVNMSLVQPALARALAAMPRPPISAPKPIIPSVPVTLNPTQPKTIQGTTVPVFSVSDFSSTSLTQAAQQLRNSLPSPKSGNPKPLTAATLSSVSFNGPPGSGGASIVSAGPQISGGAVDGPTNPLVQFTPPVPVPAGALMPGPGGGFYILGQNFGNTPGELHFVYLNSDTVVQIITNGDGYEQWWTDNNIGFVVPTPSIPADVPLNVQFYVKTANNVVSNRITFQFPATPPVISGFSASAGGQPNLMAVMGNFINPNPEVHFVDKLGNDTMLAVQSTSQNTAPWVGAIPVDTVVFALPTATLTSGFNGNVYVKRVEPGRRGVAGSLVPLQLNPSPIITVALPMDSSGLASPLDSGYPLGNQVSHSSDFFSGHKGNDQFYMGRNLQNGWVVDSVQFTAQSSSYGPWGSSNAYLTGSPQAGTTNPAATVHWWVDPSNNEILYTIVVNIRGHQGVPY